MPEQLLTRRQAAERLGKSEEALRWMNRQGTGPDYRIVGGQAMYREAELDAFIRRAFGVED